MNDDRTELEQALREKAAEVPYFQKAPRKMLARARRRILRNALTSVVVAGLVVAAASTGLASLRANRQPPASGGLHPSVPATTTASCTAAELRATAALQGAAGSVLGSIHVTNLSDKTCTLEGWPNLRLFKSAGHELPVRAIKVAPQWKADGASTPDGWPVVSLRPGSAAAIRVRWTNPCPQLAGPALWKVDLSGGRGTLDVFGADSPPPPCNGPTQPSTLEVGPFEPSA